jgi:tyrosine-specific transport protein
MKKTKHFFYAVATLIGYIIGAGIFGLPFVMEKIGYFPAVFLLFFLTAIILINCLALAEVVLRTKGKHYFPGLAGIYLKKKGKIFQTFSTLIGGYGGILAYIILGKIFLSSLITPLFNIEDIFFLLVFSLAGIFLIWKGHENLGKAEIIMSIFLFGIIILISLASFDKISFSNYSGFNYNKILPAFGVIIFALSGEGGIFIMRQILERKEKFLKSAILTAYGVVFLVSLLFSASMVGVFGNTIDPAALTGIGSVLGKAVEKTAVMFGLLAVFSSFLVVGSNLKNTFQIDFKLPHFLSWFLVWSVPLLLYFLGFSNFISIIALVGAVLGTLSIVIITFMLREARKKGKRKPEFKLKIPLWVNYIVALFFIGGMICEIRSFILSCL